MLSLILSAILAYRQGLDTPVTYTTRAARAEAVLPALGKLAGVDLQASRETVNEILVISVKDTSLSDILPRIATATSGQWKHDGNTLRLVPNKDLRRKEERREADQRVGELKTYLDKRREIDAEVSEAIKNPQAARARVRGIIGDPLDPNSGKRALSESQLVTKLLDGIGPETLASSHDHLFFSTAPRSRQHPFGDGVTDATDEFIRTHNNLVSPPTQNVVASSSLPTENGRIGSVQRVLLAIKSGDLASDPSEVSYHLEFLDAKGQCVFETAGGSSGFGEEEVDDVTDPSPKVPYSKDSWSFLKAVGGVAGGDEWGDFPDRLLPQMVRPLEHDPLSYYQTDELMAYAASRAKPLVADVPDDWGADQVSLLSEPDPQTVHDIAVQLKKGNIATDTGDKQFTVVMPARPVHSRLIRVDRQSIAKLVAVGEAKGIASLDDLDEFASANSYILPTGAMFAYLSAIAPVMVQMGPLQANNWRGLAFWAELSKDQRDAAYRDEKIPLAVLSSPQLAALDGLIDEGSWGAGARDGSYIELEAHRFRFAARVDPAGMHAALMPDDIARVRTPLALPGEEQPPAQPATVSSVRLGNSVQFSIKLRMGDVSQSCSLCDYSVDKNSRVYSVSKLPPDFEREVAQEQKDYAELRKTLSSRVSGGSIPPSP